MASKYSNVQKAECSFLINPFGEPQTYSGKEAWARQILDLMFYEPGTFPSDPDIGFGMAKDNFQNETYITETLLPGIKDMVNKYLPDIPFDSLSVELVDGQDARAVYTINFTGEADSIETVVVAVENTGDHIDYSKFIST